MNILKPAQRRIHKTAAAEYNVQCHLPKKQEAGWINYVALPEMIQTYLRLSLT
ncbi:hypothetical protein ACMXZI_07850 [Bacillus subtilis]|nr:MULTISPECIES: hypothetical protein [Bacillus]KIN30459.1 hypothetical protein B4068_1793 [Bacillus subtilis]KIN39605.1 hypothetical protein B4071_1810 [Bacillus subtilis]KIN44495.1 hypothetical protein B4073_1949 [Bacillus subtilis]KIN53007.1 hypothetical protein B4146_1922 [Bacillus subtilis]KIU12786.1 hypothetical protein SC09_Contig19orf01354 [Bacillus subtilis]